MPRIRAIARLPLLGLTVLVSGAVAAHLSSHPVGSQERSLVARECFQPQVDAADSTAASTGTPERALLSVEVPYWSERDSFCLGVFEDSLRDRSALERVEGDLAQYAAAIRFRASQQTADLLNGFSVRELQGNREVWERFLQQIGDWGRDTNGRLNTVGISRSELASIYRRWDATVEAAAQDSALALVQASLEPVFLRVSVVQDSLARAETELLAISGVISELDALAQDAIRRVETAQSDVRSRLLRATRAPLPLAFMERARDSGVVSEAIEGGQDRIEFVLEWAVRSQGSLLAHLILVAFLTWISRRVSQAFYLRKQELSATSGADGDEGGGEAGDVPSGEQEEGPEDGGPGEGQPGVAESEWMEGLILDAIRRRTFSAGFILSLLFIPLTFASAPVLARDLMVLLSTIPAAILILAVDTGRARLLWLPAIGLYGVLQSLLLVLPNSPVRRLVVFLAAIVGILVTTSFIRRFRKSEHDLNWGRAALLVLPAIRVGFVLAAAAEFLGFTGLGEMLTAGFVALLYLAVLLRFISAGVVGIAMAAPLTRTGEVLLSLQDHGPLIAARLRTIASLGAALIWARAFLEVFGFLGDLEGLLGAILGAGVNFGALSVSLGDVVVFAVSVWLAFLTSRFLRFVLEKEVYPRAHMPKGVPQATSSLVHYVVLTLGFVVALTASGIPMDRIALVVSALGVGIGFGLQGVVGNFVSGLVLLFERPVTVGDTVEVGTLMGTVKRVGIRASTVRTYDGAEVIVPNMDLVSNQVVNWTLSDRTRRLEVLVGVAYGTDPLKVLDILRDAANAHPEILANPAPVALFQAFGSSSLDFRLLAWVPDFDRSLGVRSELTVEVNRRLAEAGIEIPFPQRDLHVRSVAPRIVSALGPESRDPGQP
jgi:small-conductance mechanosensitive channel